MIERLMDGRVFLSYGPIQMVLDISFVLKRTPVLAEKVAGEVVEEYLRLLPLLSSLKKRGSIGLKMHSGVAEKMVEAVGRIKNEQLTPMAAVAGAFAEYALERALAEGADRIIINNGGDLAVMPYENEVLNVGVPVQVTGGTSFARIKETGERGAFGVCTSGLGGRSFTKGVASAVVTVAESASLADAAATHIANLTNLEDSGGKVTRCYAEEMDSETDIPGQRVTLKVDHLSKQQVYRALLDGSIAAEELTDAALVKGVLLVVQDEIAVVPDLMLDMVDLIPAY